MNKELETNQINKLSIVARQATITIKKIQELINQGSITIDCNFQTESRWDILHSVEYIESLVTGKATNSLHLADVNSCLESSITDSDKAYYQEWKNKGVKYLIIDGNNRKVSIDSFLRGNIKYSGETQNSIVPIKLGDIFTDLSSDSRDIFINIKLFVIIYTQASRFDLSDIFINLNKNMKLNDGESLNSYYNNAAVSIRNYAEYIKKNKLILSTGVYKLDYERRGLDHYILKTLASILSPASMDIQNLKHFIRSYKFSRSYLNIGVGNAIETHKIFLNTMKKEIMLKKPSIVVGTKNSKSNYRPQGTLFDMYIFWVCCGSPTSISKCEIIYDRYAQAFGKCNTLTYKYKINKKTNTAPFIELYGRTFDKSFVEQRLGALIKFGGLVELNTYRDELLNGNVDDFDSNVINSGIVNDFFGYDDTNDLALVSE